MIKYRRILLWVLLFLLCQVISVFFIFTPGKICDQNQDGNVLNSQQEHLNLRQTEQLLLKAVKELDLIKFNQNEMHSKVNDIIKELSSKLQRTISDQNKDGIVNEKQELVAKLRQTEQLLLKAEEELAVIKSNQIEMHSKVNDIIKELSSKLQRTISDQSKDGIVNGKQELVAKLRQTEQLLLKAEEELAVIKSNQSEMHSKVNDVIKVSSTKLQLQTRDTKLTSKGQPLRPKKLDYDQNTIGKLVTVLLYRERETPKSCLTFKDKELHRMFANVTVLTSVNSASLGMQFNSLISKVTTEYFLLLNSKHDLMEDDSDQSIQWLLYALENIPELDFVSGSILKEEKLEIPCYRLKLCNWTLSQSYEYYKSIGDIMICDEIATSFMGRTSSIAKHKLSFDEKITSLSTTDFFLQAKTAGAVSGVRPEVQFKLSKDKECSDELKNNPKELYMNLLPFAHKYKIFRFRDVESKEFDLCDKHSLIVGEDICDEKIALKVLLDGGHWAYDGTFAFPFILKNLQFCLNYVTDFLTLRKIPYAVKDGVALGAVKMRAILPWDAGDIDVDVYDYKKAELYNILKEAKEFVDFTVKDDFQKQVQVFCFSPDLALKLGGLVSLFPVDGPKPDFIKMKTNTRWITYRKDVFKSLRDEYGINYLQHMMYNSKQLHCKKEGHNACLPDFRTNGSANSVAGTLKEHFCDL